MSRRNEEEVSARDRLEKYKRMREEEIVDFIRDTVSELNALGDRLEVFAEQAEKKETRVGRTSRGF